MDEFELSVLLAKGTGREEAVGDEIGARALLQVVFLPDPGSALGCRAGIGMSTIGWSMESLEFCGPSYVYHK